MDIRHLKTFLVLAEELHFGRAAKRLNLTQPPLSFQIKQLEEELGTPLFQRTTRKVRLTGSGRAFVNHARFILAAMEQAAGAAERAAYGQVAALRIGTVPTEGSRAHALLVKSLHRFSREHPEVRIVLASMMSEQVVQSLVDDELDIGLVNLPVDHDLVVFETVQREPLVLALPKHHRLASQKRIPWKALATENVIVSSHTATAGLCAVVGRHLRSLGLRFTTNAPEADRLYNALALVTAGLGIAFIPGLPPSMKKQNIVVRGMQTPQLYIDTAVAYQRGGLSTQAALFLDVVKTIKG